MRYSPEVTDFIAANVAATTTKDLIETVNARFGTDFTEAKMKSYKANHKLKSGTPCGLPAGNPTDLFPVMVQCFIADNYYGVGPKDMAELLNKTFGTNYTKNQMKSYYGNHKVNSGLDGRYNKGNVPQNKGKKGYCPPGCDKGWFQKGNTPVNHKPVGSERIDKDGYTLIKIAEPNVWLHKHKALWEQVNGKVPKGHAVLFGDGNKENLTLDNLILISRRELAILNQKGLICQDIELTKAGLLIANIYMKRNDLIKKQRKGQRNSERDPHAKEA